MTTKNERRSGSVPMVSATQLGQHVFCQQTTWLEWLNAKLSDDAHRRMQEGTAAHVAWEARQGQSRSGNSIVRYYVVVVLLLLALVIAQVILGFSGFWG